MRAFIYFFTFISSFLSYSQNVFEYNSINKFNFKVYNEDDGKYYKISNEKDFKQDLDYLVNLV